MSNFLFLVLLVRSGLQILADHPRLYWNVHCTPGSEWLRLTPVEVPKDRVWTAKEDSRHLSPLIGMARHWHFLSVLFWAGNGLVFVVLLSAAATACRKPARLQDGQLDPGDRVRRERRIDQQGRWRFRGGQRVFRRTGQHLTPAPAADGWKDKGGLIKRPRTPPAAFAARLTRTLFEGEERVGQPTWAPAPNRIHVLATRREPISRS